MFKTILPLLILIFLFGCGGSNFPDDISKLDKGQLIEAVQSIDKKIKEVKVFSLGVTGKELNISIHQESLWDDGSAISYPMVTINKICSNIYQAKGRNDIASLVFNIFVPTEDTYGNKSVDRIYALKFDRTDLSKINWNNFDSFKLSNFAKIKNITPLGRKVFLAYCKENLKYSPSLCGQLF